MVPKFADYWKEQTGRYPARLLFDSRATTYAGLNQLTQRQVGFITIRRRGSGMLARVGRLPAEQLAALPDHPGQGEASPGPVRRRTGPTRRLRRRPCGN